MLEYIKWRLFLIEIDRSVVDEKRVNKYHYSFYDAIEAKVIKADILRSCIFEKVLVDSTGWQGFMLERSNSM